MWLEIFDSYMEGNYNFIEIKEMCDRKGYYLYLIFTIVEAIYINIISIAPSGTFKPY
jgi:hypothetical protein